jgi:hypothetical protein
MGPQDTPKEQASSEPQSASSPDRPKEAKSAESNEGKVVAATVLLPISEEALREKIREIIAETDKPSRFRSILNTLLVPTVVTFLFTGVVGQWFTAYLTKRQVESTARRSFTDELNKIRIQKFGEVWELLDEDELAIDSLLAEEASEGAAKSSDANNEKSIEIRTLIHRDRVIVSKNRFWLGEKTYEKARGYLNKSIVYALNQLMAGSESDLSALKRLKDERDHAKQDILQARSLFLEGELGP